jgi:hypothetical protein
MLNQFIAQENHLMACGASGLNFHLCESRNPGRGEFSKGDGKPGVTEISRIFTFLVTLH